MTTTTTTTQQTSYPNITLSSPSNDIFINVFLPPDVTTPLNDDKYQKVENAYYESSRFEHGSMIGPINILSTPQNNQQHVLYGSDLWRVPHDAQDAESGIGFASEFGFGDDGSYCYIGGDDSQYNDNDDDDDEKKKKCATTWYDHSLLKQKKVVTNGILGYEDALEGESFLKIGVGELIKGSCLACGDDKEEDVYHFNSPYRFASKKHLWKMTSVKEGEDGHVKEIAMEQKAVIGGEKAKHHRHRTKVGFHLQKTISISSSNILSIQSKLTNLGSKPFTTPWYSHHFFTCDGVPVGEGYSLQLGLKPILDGEGNAVYQELGNGIWSTPIADYASVFASSFSSSSTTSAATMGDYNTIEIQMKKQLQEGTRIKAEFPKDTTHNYGDASFILRGCSVSMKEDIPELQLYQQQPRQRNRHLSHEHQKTSELDMFAYNVYMERGTISPEPILLVELEPGESKQWTQRVEFNVADDDDMKDDNIETIEKEEASYSSLLQWEENTVLPPPPLLQHEKGKNSNNNSSFFMTSLTLVVGAIFATTMWVMIKRRWNRASNNERVMRRRDYEVIPSVNV